MNSQILYKSLGEHFQTYSIKLYNNYNVTATFENVYGKPGLCQLFHCLTGEEVCSKSCTYLLTGNHSVCQLQEHSVLNLATVPGEQVMQQPFYSAIQ